MVEASSTSLELDLTTDNSDASYWIPERKRERDLEDEYILGDIIGRGASSKVYKCLHKGKTEWACKVFEKIQLREVFETRTEIQLILELVTGGELFERIVERGHYSERDAAEAVRQILSALQYLHAHGVVHRDLKPENLLYESEYEDSHLKLADFGLSKILRRGNLTMNTLCGTVGYCAPEILLSKEYDASVDLWSLGVVTYIMLCGFEPFWDDTGEMAVCRHIVEGEFSFPSPWWDDISDSAKNLITQLLHIEPLKRPTATEVLNHPWVRGETTRQNHMSSTIKRLREFNARRKFRAATHAVLATHRAMYLISPERKTANKNSPPTSQYK
ncbi:Calcium/calmodulin-dependent protein kinase type IV [Zootermopsis nevadensis]|uniref:Calcium/calmodulin-dependent protein kinase type IV n=1 Tax=Zootermopsis nevadensis TaxID=136037 RepID=A0A067R7Q6_ZOONE|nr:Calcium/calmodulin-dependent protein kinase type IV [Zootermopsis nevadensis]